MVAEMLRGRNMNPSLLLARKPFCESECEVRVGILGQGHVCNVPMKNVLKYETGERMTTTK